MWHPLTLTLGIAPGRPPFMDPGSGTESARGSPITFVVSALWRANSRSALVSWVSAIEPEKVGR